ncbi:hypothetical protein M408DRAFT_19495 [Serendipita vermifera MAFF 305830]|uniref:DUF6533 domain-containing protein n=1 Tax=Serendipita vermifera MAFF 305830 TaxID=933852 RepID=A0A0C2XWB2_SERVB|nr:hypothetical protein M408DRAFT_19495 [Serendipita vermifera MAFF 305830]
MAQSSAINELITSLVHIQASRYTCAAAMTVMFYDFALTISDEIKFVWSGSQKMSSAKLMFIWNRYLTIPWIVLANYHLANLRPPLSNTLSDKSLYRLFHLLTCSPNSCKVAIVSIALMQGISIMVGVQLLALRVLALYKNSRKVRIALFSWLAACHITLYTIVFISMARFVPFLIYLPGTNTCYTISDKLITYIYIPPILAETGILVLQVYHHVQKNRTGGGAFQTTLVTTLYRDGYLYFAMVMSLRLLCLFIYLFAPASLWFLANQMDFPISTALISRFFIQLRGAVPGASPVLESTIPAVSSRTAIGSRNRPKSPQLITSYGPMSFPTIQDYTSPEETLVPLQQLRKFRPSRLN